MIPMNSRPAIDIIAEQYINNDYEIVVVGDVNDDLLSFYTKNRGWDFIGIDDSASLAETIKKAMNSLVNSEMDILTINFADTYIPDSATYEEDTVFFYKDMDTFRWTSFDLDKSSKILKIKEKNTYNGNEESMLVTNIFTGVFIITNAKLFISLLKDKLNTPNDGDVFYPVIKDYFNSTNTKFISDTWYDFGHIDGFYKAKIELGINQRAFNSIKIDRDKGVLTKTSQHTAKFKDEIEWQVNLPNRLTYLIPRIFEYNVDNENPFIQQEYYSYPVLMDLFLYGNMEMSMWLNVLNKLKHFVLPEMNNTKDAVELKNKMKTKEALYTMYRTKTIERLYQIDENKFSGFMKDNYINGTRCYGLKSIKETILDDVISVLFLGISEYINSMELSVLHGDLCLSNILYDQRSGFIKLIDPRGSFGEYKLLGDQNYDFAKLSHSFNGGYDHILNGMFNIKRRKVVDDNFFFDYSIKTTIEQDLIINLYNKIFSPTLEVRAIESFLFLSMVPLHADKPKSQEVFLARGIELLNEVYKECILS